MRLCFVLAGDYPFRVTDLFTDQMDSGKTRLYKNSITLYHSQFPNGMLYN